MEKQPTGKRKQYPIDEEYTDADFDRIYKDFDFKNGMTLAEVFQHDAKQKALNAGAEFKPAIDNS